MESAPRPREGKIAENVFSLLIFLLVVPVRHKRFEIVVRMYVCHASSRLVRYVTFRLLCL
jgi:hypothetical protein